MTEKPSQHTEQAITIRDPAPKPYNKPKLTLFGRVGELTQGGSFDPNPDANSTMMGMSDQRFKENIREVGRHPCGFGLYLFDYQPRYREKWGQGRQFGVMADEIETVMPEAVSVHPDGYKMVNYGMLGISRNLN